MKKILSVFLGILVLACLAGVIWCCYSSVDKVSTTQIPETNQKVVTEETTTYEIDKIMVLYNNHLVDGTDTIATCSGINPFINARAVVCIPKKGVYDCRNGNFKQILSLEDGICRGIVTLENDQILIRVNYPKQKTKFLGSRSVDHIYDMRSQKLIN